MSKLEDYGFIQSRAKVRAATAACLHAAKAACTEQWASKLGGRTSRHADAQSVKYADCMFPAVSNSGL
jgi:hypothetical protein